MLWFVCYVSGCGNALDICDHTELDAPLAETVMQYMQKCALFSQRPSKIDLLKTAGVYKKEYYCKSTVKLEKLRKYLHSFLEEKGKKKKSLYYDNDLNIPPELQDIDVCDSTEDKTFVSVQSDHRSANLSQLHRELNQAATQSKKRKAAYVPFENQQRDSTNHGHAPLGFFNDNSIDDEQDTVVKNKKRKHEI